MAAIILFAPLVGAILCGFGYKWLGEKAAIWIATGLLFLAFVLSWIVFLSFDGTTTHHPLFRWIVSGTLVSDWGIRLDRLTAIMLIVVTTVSAFVHLYSVGYMDHDANWKPGESYLPRFFAYLSFFTFAMLMLVTADNLLQMFFGWEGVGVASYLLIGFYYRKASANAAAIKAFIVNRIGDFGFLLGIFTLYFLVELDRARRRLSCGARARGHAGELPLAGVERGRAGGGAAVHRRLRQVGAAVPAHLAAGCDGGPDAGLGADPRRDHGDGGGVPGLPDVADLRVRALCQELRRHHRRLDGVLRGDRRAGAERHQAGDRLLDLLAARLHVRGGRRRGLLGGDVPPVHPCVLQGAAVPRLGVGHHRDAPRAGHAELRRAEGQDPADLLGDGDRDAGDHRRRDTADLDRLRRLPVEGRDHRERLGGRHRAGGLRLLAAGALGADDVVLLVAADLPDLLRRAARRPSRPRARAREPAHHADPARGAGGGRGARRHDLVQAVLRQPRERQRLLRDPRPRRGRGGRAGRACRGGARRSRAGGGTCRGRGGRGGACGGAGARLGGRARSSWRPTTTSWTRRTIRRPG